MSKYVKSLVAEQLRHQLANVQDALLVNVIGLDANTNSRLRAELRGKNIHLMVVKNSLAARATQGTPLAPLMDGVAGTAAICWGSEDIVSLAKEITRIIRGAKFGSFEARGGVMDGEPLTAVQVAQVSRWPSRTEQLSILVGQILSPGALLASQLNAVGGALASQIEQRGKGGEEADAPEAKAADAPEAKAADAPEGKAADVPEAKAADVPEAKAADVPETKAADVPETKAADVPETKAADVPEEKKED